MGTYERPANDETNNVTIQRCEYAYEYANPFIAGKKAVDIGCGHGFGTILMSKVAARITGVDYSIDTIEDNKKKYKDITNMDFVRIEVPPLTLPDNTYDVVTAFQFIEHIHRRKEFLQEALRILKPGGTLLVTTPNIKKSLARNPFHVHEYTFAEMEQELKGLPATFKLMGLKGNEKVNSYYAANEKFVRSVLRWDIFGLHKILPAGLLVKPYNFITKVMRRNLKEKMDVTSQISTKDFHLDAADLDAAWDIYVIATKN